MRARLLIVSYLLLVSISIRLPFFFADVINWDESTFILMGQSILDGHLPYIELWDLKPPLAFVPYALFIALLGKTIVAIRLGGAIFVWLTSWLIYSIGENIWHRRVGILAGTFFIVLSSLISGGQATLSEHIALLPLIGGLAVLILDRSSLIVLFTAGVLLTIATLIRLNLAYVVVAVGFWVLLTRFKLRLMTLWQMLAYSLGSFGTILLTYIPYMFTKTGNVWFNSVVLAPLSYSNTQKSVWKALQAQINFILASISPVQEINNFLPDRFDLPESLLPEYELPVELVGIALLVWIGGILGAIAMIKHWHQTDTDTKRQSILLAIFFLATEISIIKSGATFEHYYIQAVPFFALGAGWYWHERLQNKNSFILTIAIASLVFISLKPIFTQYQFISDRLFNERTLNYGVGYEIANFLERENPNKEPVYLMGDHIAYWFSGLNPISKSTTHPSNISREYLLQYIPGSNPSTTAELNRILATKPKFIVKPEEVFYIKEDSPARLLLDNTLAARYQSSVEIQGRKIYQIN